MCVYCTLVTIFDLYYDLSFFWNASRSICCVGELICLQPKLKQLRIKRLETFVETKKLKVDVSRREREHLMEKLNNANLISDGVLANSLNAAGFLSRLACFS